MLTRLLKISPGSLLRRRILANPRTGVLQVLREMNRSDSRYYVGLLAEVLASLPDDILSSESLVATFSKRIPLENKSNREILLVVSASMYFCK